MWGRNPHHQLAGAAHEGNVAQNLIKTQIPNLIIFKLLNPQHYQVPLQTVSTNICERMGRSQELSEFQRGTVIGCHLCNKSSREISSLLNIPQSTVSCIIRKWKRLGTTATQPRSGRPRKMTERGQRMLRRIVHRGHQLSAGSIATDLQTSVRRGCQHRSRQVSAESIATDLQTSCGLQVSSRTVRRELHGMGFHGHGFRKCSDADAADAAADVYDADDADDAAAHDADDDDAAADDDDADDANDADDSDGAAADDTDADELITESGLDLLNPESVTR